MNFTMEQKVYKKVVLVILDGFGVASYSHGNAIALAEPNSLDNLVAHYPSVSLLAYHGERLAIRKWGI